MFCPFLLACKLSVLASAHLPLRQQQESRRRIHPVELHELELEIVESRADVGPLEQQLDPALILAEEATDDAPCFRRGHLDDRGHDASEVTARAVASRSVR